MTTNGNDDIYQRFDLPPPPPATFLSRDHSLTRARIPNFQNADELRVFVHGMATWRHPGWAQHFYLASAAVLLTYLCAFIVLIFIHLRRRTWRLWKLDRAAYGTLIVPHVHNGLSLCGSFYLAVVSTCLLTEYASFRREVSIPHLPLWVICMFMPLALGVWWQLWGVVIAAIPRRLATSSSPSTAGPSAATRGTQQRASHLPAFFLNAFFLGAPWVVFVGLVIPTALADVSFMHVRRTLLPNFQRQYGDQTELSRQMLIDAQEIWNQLLHMCFLISSALLSWAIIGVFIVFAYILIVYRTAGSLRAFLKATQQTQQRSQQRQQQLPPQPDDAYATEDTLVVPGSRDGLSPATDIESEGEGDSEEAKTPILPPPPSKPSFSSSRRFSPLSLESKMRDLPFSSAADSMTSPSPSRKLSSSPLHMELSALPQGRPRTTTTTTTTMTASFLPRTRTRLRTGRTPRNSATFSLSGFGRASQHQQLRQAGASAQGERIGPSPAANEPGAAAAATKGAPDPRRSAQMVLYHFIALSACIGVSGTALIALAAYVATSLYAAMEADKGEAVLRQALIGACIISYSAGIVLCTTAHATFEGMYATITSASADAGASASASAGGVGGNDEPKLRDSVVRASAPAAGLGSERFSIVRARSRSEHDDDLVRTPDEEGDEEEDDEQQYQQDAGVEAELAQLQPSYFALQPRRHSGMSARTGTTQPPLPPPPPQLLEREVEGIRQTTVVEVHTVSAMHARLPPLLAAQQEQQRRPSLAWSVSDGDDALVAETEEEELEPEPEPGPELEEGRRRISTAADDGAASCGHVRRSLTIQTVGL
ncbi:hypothetical protein OC834_001528 [Tilletia horrida]|uniref:Transmembrane protein n=1 Tax=Tilletia horrida TaxID=155126 RepID=A0AAN6GBC6_9BASI|nr:hypothetical protein OC842_004301 [Tilletia horrida]KAK0535412.1 hypothetical protein OC834_001528 [Tilletia horrida]